MNTTLHITKDNFIAMIPKMYSFFDDFPSIKLVSSIDEYLEDDSKQYEHLIRA